MSDPKPDTQGEVLDLDSIERLAREGGKFCISAGTGGALITDETVLSLVGEVRRLRERVAFLDGASAHLETDRDVVLRQRDEERAENERLYRALALTVAAIPDDDEEASS